MASIEGSLFNYGTDGLVAFESPSAPDTECQGYIIFLGGLGDGLMAVSYITELVETMTPKGYSVIQPLMRSSYTGYGIHNLEDDCHDIDQLIGMLQNRFHGDNADRVPTFVLLGHSTGCQDIITYLKIGKNASLVSAAVLQGPVSDREYMHTLPDAEKHLEAAKRMVDEGRGRELMAREAWGVPITADRYMSLAGRLTPDDLFSSDFTDAELEALYEHISIPTLWVWGMEDEYMPGRIDKRHHAERLEWAIKCDSEIVFIEGANHALDGHSARFCQELVKFITNRQEVFQHSSSGDGDEEAENEPVGEGEAEAENEESGSKRALDNEDTEEGSAKRAHTEQEVSA